jgi:hypothetical protein
LLFSGLDLHDLHRITCGEIGLRNHERCGWCLTHEQPRFHCGASCATNSEPTSEQSPLDNQAPPE